MSDGVRIVTNSVRKVLDSARKVSDGARKVSDGVIKVSDGVRKTSDGARKVSDGFRKYPEYILKDSWCAQSIFTKTRSAPRVYFERLLAGGLCGTYYKKKYGSAA